VGDNQMTDVLFLNNLQPQPQEKVFMYHVQVTRGGPGSALG
jgi:hypothetical protein